MIHEYRQYETAHSGQLPRLSALIEASLPAFRRHGMKVVGCWSTFNGISENNNQIIYILEFRDLAHRDECWASYRADKEAAADASRITGGDFSLLARVRNFIMNPTEFSPPVAAE